ncbi:NAD-dependent epimerase/dehydratase family protein [Daejeonella sp.]|uniref:NAD-dependent epimerase/dehydratase family protein n=1 Tax=Daejeonella sp. TaxID=2805397 RepID=UPI002CC6310C|nr:NAD-dependent epimerase/dehydratase family protein [Daejeonella sp.]HQT58819.1 NAD-dependent epimerase/dehydratase family protein [Daejeonella sp.]
MKILLTGSSGFLGRHILEVLSDFEIITLSRREADICIDLSQDKRELPVVDVVIHAAGKAHSVPKTKEESDSFFTTNLIGTINLLENLSRSQAIPRMFVYISSVSVYGLARGKNINEDTALLATDPYGLSKIQAEKVIIEWCKENDVICTILRLPLLIGKNPKGNLKNMINSILKGYYFNVGTGSARKSMVLAGDIAKAIPIVAEIGGIYNLTDGYHPSFSELANKIAQKLGRKRPGNLHPLLCKIAGWTGDIIGDKFPLNTAKLAKINADLTFDDSKAKSAFQWHPSQVLNNLFFLDNNTNSVIINK